MVELVIKTVNGKWTLNGKSFDEFTPNEKNSLDNHFEDLKNCLERANDKLKSLSKSNLKEHNYQFK